MFYLRGNQMKRFIGVVVVGLMLVLGFAARASASPNGEMFQNVHSGYCLANGTSGLITTEGCPSATDDGRFDWNPEAVPSGWSDPAGDVVLQSDSPGQCLEVAGASTSVGADIIGVTCPTSGTPKNNAEAWVNIYPTPDGVGVEQQNVHSGLCLTGSPAAGVTATQVACETSGSPNHEAAWISQPPA